MRDPSRTPVRSCRVVSKRACSSVGSAGRTPQQGRRTGPRGGRAGVEPNSVREARNGGHRVAPHVSIVLYVRERAAETDLFTGGGGLLCAKREERPPEACRKYVFYYCWYLRILHQQLFAPVHSNPFAPRWGDSMNGDAFVQSTQHSSTCKTRNREPQQSMLSRRRGPCRHNFSVQ